MTGLRKTKTRSLAGDVLSLAAIYILLIPFIAVIYSLNELLGFFLFVTSFSVFSILVLSELSSYIFKPKGMVVTTEAAPEKADPLQTLSKTIRLASSPEQDYFFEVAVERIRSAFIAKLRLQLDVPESEIPRLLSDRRRCAAIVKDELLEPLLLQPKSIPRQERQRTLSELVTRIEAWGL